MLLLGLAPPAAAQNLGLVVRDGTLGSGPLEVGAGVDTLGQPASYLITPELGHHSGTNLFHSFLRFGIGANETATFTGPDGIEHVISRVTGGEISQIDGTLRSTIPGAAVWLLNPSGIVFGAGAVLEVPGSFHASTADYLGFDGVLERYYADPTLPSVLATARPGAFGFLPDRDAAPLGVDHSHLEVNPGETLELVGGDITLRGAELVAPVGTISLRGGRIVIDEGSQVLAENEGTGDGGRIDVAASESLTVDDGLLSVNTHSSGSAGTIHLGDPDHPIPVIAIQNGPGLISTSLPVETARGVRAETTSTGAGGEIIIYAGELTVAHGVAVDTSAIGVLPEPVSRGASGNIEIHAQDVTVADRAYIATGGWGSTSPVGTVRIDLGDDGSLLVDALTDPQIGGPRYAWIFAKSGGTPGSLEIRAGSIELANLGVIGANSEIGDGGTVDIRAGTIDINTGGRISAGTTSAGNGGDITLDVDSIAIHHGLIETNGRGSGNAGRIRVSATESIVLDDQATSFLSPFVSLVLFDQRAGQAGISSAAFAGGDGGSIALDAPEITVTNGAFIFTATVGSGNAGDISLEGDRIRFLNGGFADSTSFLRFPGTLVGAAGSIEIRADQSIEIAGRDPQFGGPSRVSSAALSAGAPGNVSLAAPLIVVDGGAVAITAFGAASARGSIEIAARELLVRNGGLIDASTFGVDRGGSIDITAGESIAITGGGSGIASRTGGAGVGGDVTLRAPSIEVSGGGEVSAASVVGLLEVERIFFAEPSSVVLIPQVPAAATGDAGAISLVARDLVHLDGGSITTDVGVARGGNIAIDPEFVILQHGSRITSEATELTGRGGHIQITTDNLFVFPGSVISAQGRTPELSGTVEIHSPDVNLAGTLAPLPSAFLDTTSLMRERCAARNGERAGSFAVRGAGGIPAEPDGWLPAPLLADAPSIADTPAAPPKQVASLEASVLATGACP